ncbi:MAG: septal ring lytic transglycosylase RlpA family protein [Hyphomicrobium sp.]
MKSFVSACLAVAAIGLPAAGMSSAPASAAAQWSCTGAEYVCGPTNVTAGKTKANSAKVYSNRGTKTASYKSRGGKRYANVSKRSKNRVARSYPSGGSSGIASYYWQPQAVASGGRFNPNALTAAHKTLPFGTRVRVTNRNNGRSVVVTINDRGPYIKGRVIDLSRRAAQVVGMTGSGIAPVSYSVVGRS